jgi:8-oxo-dGTP pyrophosphatase MutT (NUDIX family)
VLPPGAINEGAPVTPRPSATVLLIRGRRPWELLLMRRPGGADFAPGAYVFPGGTVHADDMGWGDEIRMAAVREMFEEVGILLARRGGRFARETGSEQVRAIIAGGKTFGEALRKLRLEPALDRLVIFARWVTPSPLRRRYDARFFLAKLPAGQVVRPQEGEVTDWTWITPERALVSPEITLVYATRAVLESVASEPDAAKLFSSARRLKEVPVVEPKMVQTESGWEIARD